MENNFDTTVATPLKWPGRDAPSQRSLTPYTETVVAGGAGHDGYISATGGTKTTSAPASAHTSRSRSSVLGYRSMSSGSPNCSGLTKMLTATTSHSARARATSEVCPSCSAPMVGTSPTTRPVARARSRASRQAAAVSTTSIAPAGLHRRRHGRQRGVGAGQPGRQRGAGLVARALVFGERVEVAAESGPVAPAGGARQRGARAQRGHVVHRGAGQRQERLEVQPDSGRHPRSEERRVGKE